MHRPHHDLRKLAVTLFTGLLLTLGFNSASFAQSGRPDQVFLKGSSRQETGTITTNGLVDVIVAKDGKDKRLDATRVERVIWGAVCASYREGQTYFERGDFENAAAKFNLAATEDERDVIKADARKRAGEALLHLGAKDPSQLELALDAFKRFIADYPDSRLLPEVRSLQARATRLRGNEGDIAQAGAMYRSLFEAGSGATPTPGYGRLLSFEAGVHAIRALTDSGDTLGAREIAGILAVGVNAMMSEVEADSAASEALRNLSAEVQLAQGFVLLASAQGREAETFFNSQMQQAPDGPAALRYGAMLGLGGAYFAQGKFREASVQFATVAAIDYTDRDRTAKALYSLAETQLKLEDKDGLNQAKLRLNLILESFGDTPSAARARALLKTL